MTKRIIREILEEADILDAVENGLKFFVIVVDDKDQADGLVTLELDLDMVRPQDKDKPTKKGILIKGITDLDSEVDYHNDEFFLLNREIWHQAKKSRVLWNQVFKDDE